MLKRLGTVVPIIFVAVLIVAQADATSLPRLSFEELTDTSDLIAAGRITSAWAAWDTNHKYIWTHYLLSVASSQKGAAGSKIEFAEPGGTLEGVALSVPGAVAYQPGENVLVFLQRMPNGYLRTTGWGQGKYEVGANGRLQGDATLKSADLVDLSKISPTAATPLRTLNGMSVGDVALKIAARTGAALRRQQ